MTTTVDVPWTEESPTMGLRFVVREDNGPGSRRILQQCWTITTGQYGQGISSRIEWRDVPLEVE